MYSYPQPLPIPADTRIPALEVNTVERALAQQKRTSSGADERFFLSSNSYDHKAIQLLITTTVGAFFMEAC